MRNSQVSYQNTKLAKFYQIKQLEYFKQILRKISDIHIKQILPLYVHKHHTKQLNHQKYIYIPQRNIDQHHAGFVIESTKTQLSKKVYLYSLDKKLDKLFHQILVLEIPVLNTLRIQDRFDIFRQSILQKYPFNRTIYRHGEKFMGIFYLIEGQLKVIHQKTNKLIKIIAKNNWISLKQLQIQTSIYLQTIISNSNDTKMLFISIQTLNKIGENSQIILKVLFNSFYSKFQQQQNTNVISDESRTKRIQKIQNEKKISKNQINLNIFVKKSEDFINNTTKNDNGFNQYVKHKKILLQLRQTIKNKKPNLYCIKQFPKKQNQQYQISDHNKIKSQLSNSRSQILKQNILKRLELNKSYCNTQTFRSLCLPININTTRQLKQIKRNI